MTRRLTSDGVTPDAVNAIRNADLMIVGPGSLYTSVLPNVLVPDIRLALQESRAMTIYVSNVATQHGETDGLSAGDHLRVFERHSGVSVTHVLANSRVVSLAPEFQQEPLLADDPFDGFDGVIMRADVIDASLLSRHDSGKLAAVINRIARQT